MRAGIVAALVALWIPGYGVAAARAGMLVIRVFDQVGIPEQVRIQALPVAQRIFQRAGIDTAWRVCRVLVPEGACEPLGDNEILLQVTWKNRGPGGEAFGLAVREGQKGALAYIFWGRVHEAGGRGAFSPGVLLGLVLCHEVGHLFGLEHSVGGLMKEGFGRLDVMQASAGTLIFDHAQAKQLVIAVRTHLGVEN